ncbi:MAG TPA: class I SAM-dependent methyltransferase [Candidatus Cybelea sp.]|jgi:SAM-dependent methyltransferase|nr:class I SAM-dependent methyltransferase [Candidatus Cybelea sp.]
MTSDPFATFKDRQREMWSSFAPTATFTTPVAANVVRFAGIARGETVLDVGTGTGVVAITAARAGARVTAIDLTPVLIEAARENAQIAGHNDIEFLEGDAEHLPYPDASFEVVLSQFGHMFAPRPEVAIAEMRRVLKPGGRLAFATWPPDALIGKMLQFVGRNSPPLPPGVAPPGLWGVPDVIEERLAPGFAQVSFERGVMTIPALSIPHFRAFIESSVGPMQNLVARFADSPEQLAALRAEFDELCGPHHADNLITQEYLLTRAAAR